MKSLFLPLHAIALVFVLGLAGLINAPLQGQVIPIFTNTFFQTPVNRGDPDGTGAEFGAPLARLGDGRFLVGAPKVTLARTFPSTGFQSEAGLVSVFNQVGAGGGASSASVTALRHHFGVALNAFPDLRFLVGTRNSTSNSSGVFLNVGTVTLVNTNGASLGTWLNPNGATDQNGLFGNAVAALSGNRFAASTLPASPGLGKVFIFSATTPNGSPLVTITNPTPAAFELFGSVVAALGTNRLLVTDPNDGANLADQAGSVFIYDLAGNRLSTIHNFTGKPDFFGAALAVVDEHRFLVGATFADVTYSQSGQLFTNGNAGKVYLYDDTGALIRTFVAPDPSTTRSFGAAISMVGSSRVLIGAPGERIGAIAGAGRAHLFNIEGLHLEGIDNPVPGLNDGFGQAVTGIDDTRFAVGAPFDDTLRTDGGSIYGYDAPLPSTEVGSEIPRPPTPPYNLDLSGTFPSQGPSVTPAGATFWHAPSQKLFAVKPGDILVTWRLQNPQGLNPPPVYNWQASLIWPTNAARFQIHVAGPTPVDLVDSGAFTHAVLHASTTDANVAAVSQTRIFSATQPGNSLLMLSSGDPTSNAIAFQLIRTISPHDPAHLHDNAPATIGQPVVDPGPYHDPACGSPQVIPSAAVYCPPMFNVATRTGTIVPVNRGDPANPNDDLLVAYYQRGTRLYNPATGAAVANTICWAYKPVRFTPQWPTDAPHLVIASQLGTGILNASQFVDWQIYIQNNPAQAGFNPNDEHALRRPIASGEGVFALRDDQATPATSEPFVLILYRDPAAGGNLRLKLWQVVAEEAPFFFRYPARAGLLIQPPFPLSSLPPALQTVGVIGPYFRDRKLFFWAKAAGDDGGASEIVMHYYYPFQPGFFSPGPNPPALGENVPFLTSGSGDVGSPADVHYDVTWPDDVPELRVGETLVKPKNGLPQIAGQSSVEILYEQSVARGTGSSVLLIDPARIRSVPLGQLPPEVQTRTRGGLFHFPALPPHLESRVNWDPVAHRLRLAGQFVEPPAGESYLLLNVLTPRDRTYLENLTTDAAWRSAVASLATEAAAPVNVPANSQGFDSLALTAGDARGTGYVSLAFANNTKLSAPSDPISISILKVTCPIYRGELKVIESPNPLAEQLTLRHSGDFGGRPQDFVFEWRTLPPADGLPSSLPPEQWAVFPTAPLTGAGASENTISGPGLHTLSDNYFIARYRRVIGPAPCGSGFSDWTAPMLAEGWIKRVLAGIGPFEQRVRDYQDTQVNTIVSMISQAGTRAVGDVALNLDAVNQAGLIEVYETVLRRGMALSIDGAPPVDYPPANDALLLVAGRLADLYMLLGNEAFADAADPTIALGTDDAAFGSQATSLHCFMNQTGSLLEEELGLLRGRDNSKLPSVQTHPIYNRFIWNFTRDITGGEVAYALNYNIRDVDGDVAGTINEADARRLYPQGHGDAWGHYLTAIKNYYRLLRNPNFTWVPRIEAVIVGGVPVSVDFLDERKFAAAAAARARTGAELVNLSFRENYVDNPAKPWQGRPDTDTNRAWGTGEWASRAGQGAVLDWIAANALLPDVDANPNHTGIQKIERGNIRELPEIAESFRQIQEQADQADSGRNPLGLANNVVPFDIDPGAIAAGKTHFEQINDRASEALKNAVAVFDHANASTQLLRRQADETVEFQQLVVNRESDFNSRLIEVFGTPYADDVGPTGTYPTGYSGPDIYHYDYVDSPEIRAGATAQQPTLTFRLTDLNVAANGSLVRSEVPVTFNFSPNGFGLEKPSTWVGQRSAPGEIQLSRAALLESQRRLERSVVEYENLIENLYDAAQSLQAEFRLNATQISLRQEQVDEIEDLNQRISDDRRVASTIRNFADLAKILLDGTVDALPDVLGLATDAFSLDAAVLRTGIRLSHQINSLGAQSLELDAADLQDEKNGLAALTELKLATAQTTFTQQERLRQLEQLVRGEPSARLELAALAESLTQAVGRYQAAVARGLRLLEERLRFRQQTAAQVQTFRYKDMAFRIFRSDALQKYRAQFDLAARYAYLAAKAYDYETCLAPGDQRGPGSGFLTPIVRSRSLGRFSNGLPLPGSGTGDPGLADPLARMNANWTLVLKGQLGFNNPQTETGRFSLRNELFRILTGPTGSQRWRETLSRFVVPNVLDLPEFQRHCIPFSPTQPVEPAIVIPFSTMVNFGVNFFGWPAGGGDNDYDSTKFATKIRSVGVWFGNYNNLGGGMINTPRVYLVPVGLDVMRSPTQGAPYVREWRILDQALPVPFPLSGGDLADPDWIPINDTLFEDFGAIRRFGRFRAFHDSGNFNPSEMITDSRLIGRSVWNTRWLLIIPGGTLHTDRNEGIQRFINGALRLDGTRDGNGVSDIRVFFQTYAYPGN